MKLAPSLFVAATLTLPLAAVAQVAPASESAPVTLNMQQSAPVTLTHMTTLPGIEGDFDFLVADPAHDRLFIAAEEHHTIEVFKASTGEHLQSVSGVKTPHALAYVPEKNEVIVADGGASAALIFSATDMHQIGRVALIDGAVTGKTDSPDTGFYDSKRHTFYIGNGGKSANLPYSEIAELDVDTHQITNRIRVEGNNLEAMAIDESHDRLFVNIRDKKQVGVIDLKTHKVVDTWDTGLNRNTALAFDAVNNLVFVGSRNPGLFTVLDSNTGKVVAQMACANTTDFMAWDTASRRIYIAGSAGLSIFHQDSRAHYTELTRVPTNGGKTGVLLPGGQKLFIVHPKTPIDDAGLLVYRVTR